MRNHVSSFCLKLVACLITTVSIGLSGARGDTPAPATASTPETVLATFHVKPGKEVELEKVLTEAWATYRRLHLVQANPHLLMRGTAGNEAPCFVEVLTWTSHDVPDHAPAEVLALWQRMEALCEPRGGHRSIEFPEVQIVGGNEQ